MQITCGHKNSCKLPKKYLCDIIKINGGVNYEKSFNREWN